MPRSLLLMALAISLIIVMSPIAGAQSLEAPSHVMRGPSVLGKIASAKMATVNSVVNPNAYGTDYYWFWAGAEPSPMPDRPTGAEVDIRITSQNKPSHAAALAYWIGMETSNHAFIQVGYLGYYENTARMMPAWFWEYFPAGKADDLSVGFKGGIGDTLPENSWVHFRLESSGDTWTVYVNDKAVGSTYLSISYGSRPYAAAEIAGSTGTDDVSLAVNFRNLGYRDSSGWHLAERGRGFNDGEVVHYYGYGIYWGERYYDSQPMGLQSTYARNNDWVAGHGVSGIADKVMLWPWYHVILSSPSTSIDHYYVIDSYVSLKSPNLVSVNATVRSRLAGWAVNGGQPQAIATVTVSKDIVLKAIYVTQYFVNVTSPLGSVTGSGWYDNGANASIAVTPIEISWTGTWGTTFRIKQVFSGWGGGFNGPAVAGKSTVHVTSPKVIVAVWRTDYGILPYLAALIIGGIAGAVGLAYYRGRIPPLAKLTKAKRGRQAKPLPD